MGRSKKKRKKKQASARPSPKAARPPQTPPANKEASPAAGARPAADPAPAPSSSTPQRAPRVQVLDLRSEDGPYPELLDKDVQDPLNFPYDKGGVPLVLLLLYLAFLGLAGVYMTGNLFPDYLRYFGGD